MTDELTVSQAAEMLATTGQTVRNHLRAGILEGGRGTDGRTLFVTRTSVERALAEHGPLGGKRRPTRKLRHEVPDDVVRQRDDLRSRVIQLNDTVARLREAADLQRRADLERANIVSGLLTALSAAERSDALRRQALAELENALAATTVPGHAGSLNDAFS